MQDHYETLGLDRGAPDEAIRAAYRSLMQKYHPDRNSSPDAMRRTGEIIAAYSVLKKPESRAVYDQATAQPAPQRAPAASHAKTGRIKRWLQEVLLRR